MIRVSDGHADLTFDYEPEILGAHAFILTMSDGGGYSSLYLTTKDWNEFKTKIDEFIAKTKALNENP